MNRLLKYKESLDRFIKNKSCLYNGMDKSKMNSLYNTTENNNKILSTMLLTIMNNQNKKKKITAQGYYAAAAIEYLNILLYLLDNKQKCEKLYGQSDYNKYIVHLIRCVNKSICSNIESVKIYFTEYSVTDAFMEIMEVYNKYISYEYLLDDVKLIITAEKLDNDVLKWYIKNNKDLENKFKSFYQIDKDSFTEYINKKIGSICNITFCMGWLLGCGDISNLSMVEKMSKHFCMVYKLYMDFINLETDILNSNNYCPNYIVNYGLHYSYDLFMKHKQKFLESCMILDTYTMTIKEVIHFIESEVEQIIDQTSPDMKSNMSNITGYTE